MCQVSAPDAAVASAASPSFLLRVVQFLVGLVEQDERDDGDGTGHVQVRLRLHAEAARALQNGQAAADDEVLHPTGSLLSCSKVMSWRQVVGANLDQIGMKPL